MEILIAVLGGSAVAAFINQAGEYLRARKTHEEQSEDKENDDISVLKEAMKFILLDRIKYLGQAYIKTREIDFDDRRILHSMHNIYKMLGGNGDLDALMDEINHLPLKIDRD